MILPRHDFFVGAHPLVYFMIFESTEYLSLGVIRGHLLYALALGEELSRNKFNFWCLDDTFQPWGSVRRAGCPVRRAMWVCHASVNNTLWRAPSAPRGPCAPRSSAYASRTSKCCQQFCKTILLPPKLQTRLVQMHAHILVSWMNFGYNSFHHIICYMRRIFNNKMCSLWYPFLCCAGSHLDAFPCLTSAPNFDSKFLERYPWKTLEDIPIRGCLNYNLCMHTWDSFISLFPLISWFNLMIPLAVSAGTGAM